jgi:hypothetical protein
LSLVFLQQSHSTWYSQLSAAHPQLYVAIMSHFSRRIRSTIQDMMFLLLSEKEAPDNHVPKPSPSVPLNDTDVSILRVGLEVSCTRTRVDAQRLSLHPAGDIVPQIGSMSGVGVGVNVDSSHDAIPPPSWRHRPTNRGAINEHTQDHGDILKRRRGLTARQVKHVGLWMPPVHKCHQHDGVHHRQTADDEPSKRQEPSTTYEQHVPLVPLQWVVHVDLQHLNVNKSNIY